MSSTLLFAAALAGFACGGVCMAFLLHLLSQPKPAAAQVVAPAGFLDALTTTVEPGSAAFAVHAYNPQTQTIRTIGDVAIRGPTLAWRVGAISSGAGAGEMSMPEARFLALLVEEYCCGGRREAMREAARLYAWEAWEAWQIARLEERRSDGEAILGVLGWEAKRG